MMTGSEIDGSRGFKSSPLRQPGRFLRQLSRDPPETGLGRVASGACAPEAPADPDMQISRIRLFGPRFRYATMAGRIWGSGSG